MSILRPFLKCCPPLKGWLLRSQSYRRKQRNQVCPYRPHGFDSLLHYSLFFHIPGLLSVWSSSDKLSSSLYTSCVKLIRHIESQSRLIMESGEPSNARSSREVPLPLSLSSSHLSLPPPLSLSLPLSPSLFPSLSLCLNHCIHATITITVILYNYYNYQ